MKKQPHSIQSERQQAMAQQALALARTALNGALEQAGHSEMQPPLRVERAPAPIAPRQMAQARSGDAAVQAQLAASYEACLTAYRDIVAARADAAGMDDVGAAMAFFVAVNLRVLQGVDVEADALQLLEHQLRGVTRRAAQWDAATRAQRQLFFERIAITSILMSRALANANARGPVALADVRRNARDYLQHLLGLDPDAISLGAEGLVVRDEAIGAPAAQ